MTTSTKPKVTDAEIVAVMRAPRTASLLIQALRELQRGEDPRDGPPRGWEEVWRLAWRLGTEAAK